MEQSNLHKRPKPLIQYQFQHVIVSHFQYEGGGTVEVPALNGDHLSITLDGANLMERRLDGRLSRGVVCAGDITLVPRGINSTWTPGIGTSNVLHLLVLPELWQSIAQTADLDPTRIELQDDFATPDPLIEQIGRALMAEAQDSWVGSQLYVQSLEQALGMRLLRHYSTLGKLEAGSSLQVSNFKDTLDYIETHLAENLSLETLAACENLSLYHFARAFKAIVGQSPHQYVTIRRVSRAQHLLTNTQLPLAVIAAQVGFANQSHLNRHFKRIVGLTPGQYRQQFAARMYKI